MREMNQEELQKNFIRAKRLLRASDDKGVNQQLPVNRVSIFRTRANECCVIESCAQKNLGVRTYQSNSAASSSGDSADYMYTEIVTKTGLFF